MSLSNDEKSRVWRAVKQFFPLASEGDAILVTERCDQYPVADVLEAVKLHRAEKGDRAFSPDARRVGGIAADRARSRASAGAKKERVIDYVRAENAKVRQLDDEAAVLAHYGEAWAMLRDDPNTPEDGRMSFRAMIYRTVVTGLTQLGKTEDDAVSTARGLVELRDGERLITRRLFKSPEEIPSKAEALRRAVDAAKEREQQAIPQPVTEH